MTGPYTSINATLTLVSHARLVATQSVLAEFRAGSLNLAGPLERALVTLFMPRITEIPDDPSARVVALVADSNSKKRKLGLIDRIAFGTGDKLGVKTITGDGKLREKRSRKG